MEKNFNKLLENFQLKNVEKIYRGFLLLNELCQSKQNLLLKFRKNWVKIAEKKFFKQM